MIRAEILKLKRSATWIIAFVLPMLAVTTASIKFANNTDSLGSEWASMTSQVTLFYGLLFYSIGISLIAATAWRMEHRGTNWHLLLTATAKPFALVWAKILVILLPVAFMQLILILGTCISGTLILQVRGSMPWHFAAAGVVSLITALPLIALQSLLSMLMRSFAAPVAICLLGCVIGVASVTSHALRPLSFIWPQGINTRALNLGSTALAGSGGATLTDVLPLIAISLILGMMFAALTLLAIRNVKLR